MEIKRSRKLESLIEIQFIILLSIIPVNKINQFNDDFMRNTSVVPLKKINIKITYPYNILNILNMSV